MTARNVNVTLSGFWNAVPGQFFDDGGWIIEGGDDHAEATDAELAEQMRQYGTKEDVLRGWDLLDLIEVYVGSEKVW